MRINKFIFKINKIKPYENKKTNLNSKTFSHLVTLTALREHWFFHSPLSFHQPKNTH